MWSRSRCTLIHFQDVLQLDSQLPCKTLVPLLLWLVHTGGLPTQPQQVLLSLCTTTLVGGLKSFATSMHVLCLRILMLQRL